MYTLEELNRFVKNCRKCDLSKTRTQTVFGQGNPKAEVMFIGEGPGYHEDRQGVAFIGPAGKLLTKAIENIGMKRGQVYIANIVKCRPPQNRNPFKEEMQTCIEYLRYQVKIINPKIIVCLGAVAARNVINSDFRITKERGTWIKKKNFWIMATFHPAAVLRDSDKEPPFFQDFESVQEKLQDDS